jgi:hypothetical protein
MQQHQALIARSSARRRLTASAARAGVEADEREVLVGSVLGELAIRLTPEQWREVCGWLPWDVCSLAGARHASRRRRSPQPWWDTATVERRNGPCRRDFCLCPRWRPARCA